MNTRHSALPDSALASIDIAASKLIRKPGFTRDDFEDVRNDIRLYVLLQWHRYDARKGAPSTFIKMVVGDASKQLLRSRFAGKRQRLRMASRLDAEIARDDEGNGISLLDLLDADEIELHPGRCHRPRQEQAHLRFDVRTTVSGLPKQLRECCIEIMRGRTFRELAREKGLPRSTFRDRFIVPIRRVFEAAGLRDWLRPIDRKRRAAAATF